MRVKRDAYNGIAGKNETTRKAKTWVGGKY
jgi:hypothetical protein